MLVCNIMANVCKFTCIIVCSFVLRLLHFSHFNVQTAIKVWCSISSSFTKSKTSIMHFCGSSMPPLKSYYITFHPMKRTENINIWEQRTSKGMSFRYRSLCILTKYKLPVKSWFYVLKLISCYWNHTCICLYLVILSFTV